MFVCLGSVYVRVCIYIMYVYACLCACMQVWMCDDIILYSPCSCQIAFSFTMKLISHKATDVSQMLNWLKQILGYQQQFLQMHKVCHCVCTREDYHSKYLIITLNSTKYFYCLCYHGLNL